MQAWLQAHRCTTEGDAVRSEDWDDRYRKAREDAGGVWVAEPPLRLKDALADLPPGTALDLATGDGRTSLWLAGRGWQTTALDFSPEALRTARERALERGVPVTWVEADATTWQPHDRFNVVVVAYLHLPEADNLHVLRHAASWVAPGGHLLVLGHDKQNIATGAPGPKDANILYSPDLLARAVAGVLDILECATVARDTAIDPESPNEAPRQALDTFLRARARGARRAAAPARYL